MIRCRSFAPRAAARNWHEVGTDTCGFRRYAFRRVAGGPLPTQGGDRASYGAVVAGGMIPLSLDEVARARAGRASGRRRGDAGDRPDRRLAHVGARGSLRRGRPRARVRRRGARRGSGGRAPSRGRFRRARLDRPRRPRALVGPRGRHHRARSRRRRRRTSSPRWSPRSPARSRRRAARTTRSASRSRSAGSSQTPRSACSRWACGASARSPSSATPRSPEIGVITKIGPVHLELLGTLERVAQAKAELIDALPAGGVGGRSRRRSAARSRT